MKEVEIYTDGACSGNPGPGGFGVFMIYKSNEKVISDGYLRTTNNRMEVLAAITGLEALLEPCRVKLYSDSRYLVDAAEKGWLKKWRAANWVRGKKEPVPNSDLWMRLILLLEKHDVKFIWVKGHAANPGNEKCDRLAAAALRCENLKTDEGYLRSQGGVL